MEIKEVPACVKTNKFVNEEKLGKPWLKNRNVEGRNEMEYGLGKVLRRRKRENLKP